MQAVEFLAEWSLAPTNVAFLRVQTGVFDPSVIGDKPKWYCDQYEPLPFAVWDDSSSMDSALRAIGKHDQLATGTGQQAHACNERDLFFICFAVSPDESGSDSEGADSTSSSYSSLSDLVSELASDVSPGKNDLSSPHADPRNECQLPQRRPRNRSP